MKSIKHSAPRPSHSPIDARLRSLSEGAAIGLRVQTTGAASVSLVGMTTQQAPHALTKPVTAPSPIDPTVRLVALIRANTALLREAYLAPDIENFVEVLGAASRSAVAVFDPLLLPLAVYDPNGSMSAFEWLRTQASLPDLVTASSQDHLARPAFSSTRIKRPAHVISPIKLGGRTRAYLVLATWDYDVLDDALVYVAEQAAAIATVVLSRSDRITEASDDVEASAIEALAGENYSSQHTFALLLRSAGIDPDRVYKVVAFSSRAPMSASGTPEIREPATMAVRESVYKAIIETVRRNFPESAVGTAGDQLIVMYSVPKQDDGGRQLGRLVDLVIGVTKGFLFDLDLAAGVSSKGFGRDIRVLLEQARKARTTADLLNITEGMVEYDWLGVDVLLSSLTDSSALNSYVRQVLGPLLDYDSAHGTDLVATLSAYLRHSTSQQAAARELHIHSNTVNYRLTRARELVRFDAYADRLAVQLATHIHERLNSHEETPLVGRP